MTDIVKADKKEIEPSEPVKEPIEILAKWIVEHIKESPKISVAVRESKIEVDRSTPYLWAKNGKLLEKMRELASADNAIAAFEIEQGVIEDARQGKDRGIYFKYIAKEPERIEHSGSVNLTAYHLSKKKALDDNTAK
jgi:hypothetical protein